MWKVLKVLGFFLKLLFWMACLAALLAVLALYVAERGIPSVWVRKVTDRLSTKDFTVRVDRVTYTLRDGLRVQHPALLTHGQPAQPEKFISADEVQLDFSIQPDIPWTRRIRHVTIKGASFPALPPKGQHKEPRPIFNPTLPDMAPFRLTLVEPKILGIHARKLEAWLDVNPHALNIKDVQLDWPEEGCPVGVAGWCGIDLGTRLVNIHLQGEALPSYITPLLGPDALRAKTVVRELDKFQAVKPPVKAIADISLNIDSCDYAINLDIDAGPCEYNGTSMLGAKGKVCATETNSLSVVTIGPLDAKGSTGTLSGTLYYQEAFDSIDFQGDAVMDLPQLSDIIGVLNKGQLNCVKCSQAPHIKAFGVVSDKVALSATNTINGRVELPAGSILNLKIKDAIGDFTMNAYTARFDNVTGESAHGGKISGNVVFHFPDFDEARTTFETRAKLEKVDLMDLAEAVNVTNAQIGEVSGTVTLRSTTSKDALSHLEGDGRARIEKGLLNRMPIFAGFTDYLAKNIPGIGALVDQSSGSMTFTIKDGVLTSNDLLIEGDVFSISGKGTYDIVNNKMNFIMRASIFRKKTLVGKITNLVTMPFTKLLLEFKVFGPLEKPDWSYVSILQKITDTFSSDKK
jgi:hypothetical protein